jgi:hypothetical protein
LSDALDQGVDARLDSSSIVPCANAGNDDFVDYSMSPEISDVALESVSHFDAKTAIFRHDEQGQTVVETLAAYAPLFECPCCPILNGNAAGSRSYPDDDLMLGLLFVVVQPRIQAVDCRGR